MGRTKNTNVQKQIYPTMMRQLLTGQQFGIPPAFQMTPPLESARALNVIVRKEEDSGTVNSSTKDQAEQPPPSATEVLIDLTKDADGGQACHQQQDDGSIPMPLIRESQNEVKVNQPLDILSFAVMRDEVNLTQPCSLVEEIPAVEDAQTDTMTSLLEFERSTLMGTGSENASEAGASFTTDTFKKPLQQVKSKSRININDVQYIADLIKPCIVNVSHSEEVNNLITGLINSAEKKGLTATITSPGAITLHRVNPSVLTKSNTHPSRTKNLREVDCPGIKGIKISKNSKMPGEWEITTPDVPKKSLGRAPRKFVASRQSRARIVKNLMSQRVFEVVVPPSDDGKKNFVHPRINCSVPRFDDEWADEPGTSSSTPDTVEPTNSPGPSNAYSADVEDAFLTLDEQ